MSAPRCPCRSCLLLSRVQCTGGKLSLHEYEQVSRRKPVAADHRFLFLNPFPLHSSTSYTIHSHNPSYLFQTVPAVPAGTQGSQQTKRPVLLRTMLAPSLRKKRKKEKKTWRLLRASSFSHTQQDALRFFSRSDPPPCPSQAL